MHIQTYFHTKLEHEANRKNDQVSLQINCTGTVVSPEFYCKSVRKDFYFIYVIKGKMLLPKQTVEAGEVLILEPGQPYEYHNEGETIYYWMHYTGFRAYEMSAAAVGRLNEKQRIGIHEEMLQCFQRLFQEFILYDEMAEPISNCLAEELLLLTARYADSRKHQTAPLRAIEYIHAHFREKIDVDELAKMENMSGTAFRNAFKRHTGISANEYIIAQRLSNACRLLKQTDMSISEAAGESGYRDQYYFSRLFKRKMGISPIKYRNQSQ